ncbi:methylated-DNA--[protein]-cysteine S-methyltransferase [Streptococcus cameli]
MKRTDVFYRITYQSPIGAMSLIANENALCAAYFIGQRYFEKGFEEASFIPGYNPLLRQAVNWLEAYFKKETAELPKVSPFGTDFQVKVWDLLSRIPLGQTVSYGQLAKALQCRSAQAIGGAVGRNPLTLFVPCHRVLGQSGQLTGYAGGLDKKIWLLTHEQATYASSSAILQKK